MFGYLVCFFVFLVFNDSVYGMQLDECSSSKCGTNGPSVRFPFRVEGKQPFHCGYPSHWFTLSCSESNQTVLPLSPSWKVFVKKIDYKSRIIHGYDSEGCLLKRLLNFNLSVSPFKFNGDYTDDFTLLNCSSSNKHQYQIPCLSDLRHTVYAITSLDLVGSYDYLLSCAKIHDISALPYSYVRKTQSVFELSWSGPNCRTCEREGKYCRLQTNSTGPETECYSKLKPGSSTKLIATGATLGSVLMVGAVVILHRMYSSNKSDSEYQSNIEKFLDDYKCFKPSRLSFSDIKRMTNHFKYELGQGAYGKVYRGKLSDEIMVAVKVLGNSKGNGEEFVNEIGTIGRIHHVNVVRLLGFCADGFHRALVYEYLPNDSLHKFISSSDTKSHFLGWKIQQGIALGIAKGIEYLHQGCDQRILHFDIKPQNILLDHDFSPQVSDFGLVKLCGKDQSALSMTTARGTIGYMAPEVFSRNFGNVSYKSDVYSFGMVVLEMVGGRKIVDEKVQNDEQIYFPEWIYNLLEEGEDLRLEIEEEEDAEIAKKLAIVGLWCIQWNPVDCPSMKTVVRILEGEGDNLPVPHNPFSSATREKCHKEASI